MIIRFSGFGGQGIVLSGIIYGYAAMLEGLNAVQTQSYGSESRGGACKSDVAISREKIYQLEPEELDVLVAMSQNAYDRYIKMLKEGGLLLIDEGFVNVTKKGASIQAIEATKIAEQRCGRKIVANIVMMGFLAGKVDLISPEALKKSISHNVPPATIELNLKAFEEGLSKAKKVKKANKR